MKNKITQKTLLIDLDGVLNDYAGNYDEMYIPPIKKGVYEFLENLVNLNYCIKIFTTRNRLLVAKWLIENGIDKYVKDVTNVKIPAYLHIDDRCVCFSGNFKSTLSAIEKFQVYWKS